MKMKTSEQDHIYTIGDLKTNVLYAYVVVATVGKSVKKI